MEPKEWKPKEWLFKNGHIKEIGRGRLSKPLIAIIEDAVANGAIIEGYTKVKPTADNPKPKAERKTEDTSRILDVPDQLRDEADFKAVVTVNGKEKEIGKKTVCNGCGNSLCWCYCASPRVWVDWDTEALVTLKSITRKE